MGETGYPIALKVDYEERASRLEVLILRPIMMIAYSFVALFWGIAYIAVAFVMWWAILILGRRPQRMWNFALRYFRYTTRVNGYYMALTDKHPPFNGRE
ncbi:MAG: DUF4389 domain-containing protein [bacterium]